MFEPARRLTDLVLDEATRKTLERIVDENRKADLLKTYGSRPANRILFCGPPGCGKTVSAEAIAAELYLPLALVRFDAVVSSYLGETAANLRKVFDFARSRPMVVLFDEFDAIGKDRASLEEHGEIKRVVNSFLQILDGFRSDTVAIAATNHQGLLDPALWRRFDEIVFFDMPVRGCNRGPAATKSSPNRNPPGAWTCTFWLRGLWGYRTPTSNGLLATRPRKCF